MRVMLICLFVVLSCSCHQVSDSSGSKNSGATMTKREEVLRLMRVDYASQMMDVDWLPPAEREALREIKDDPYAKLPRRYCWSLAMPEFTWEVRGPLTMSQVREEYIEYRAEYYRTPAEREEFRERFEETRPGEFWAGFEGTYRDGDEVYYYRADRQSLAEGRGRVGYVLIRGGSIAGEFVIFRS